MNAASDFEARTLKSKRPAAQHATTQIGPMTFHLRSESDMDKSIQEDKSRQYESTMADTTYGVQSLDDAMQMSTDSMSSLTQTSSNEGIAGNSILAGRKRKPGNPVHPKIAATGQRIVSSEYTRDRRTSISSSTHLTPLNLSPYPDADFTQSNSIKSFRLSDEEASINSDTGSQALQSSSSEEDPEVHIGQTSALSSPSSAPPQLVMPSIRVPSYRQREPRPFTERGKSMGHLSVLVTGAGATGKTSLIQNAFKLCHDIVWMENENDLMTRTSNTSIIEDVFASTKPIPAYDLIRKHLSMKNTHTLEQNLRFIDTIGIDSHETATRVYEEVLDTFYTTQIARLQNTLDLHDVELVKILTGKGCYNINVVLYLFEPEEKPISDAEIQLLQRLSSITNLVPLLARCDELEHDALHARKQSLFASLQAASIEMCSLDIANDSDDQTFEAHEVYTVSSSTNDNDIMDASTLMASTYAPALYPSDLRMVINALLEPSTIERLQHLSAIKLMNWQRQLSMKPEPTPAPATSPRRNLLGFKIKTPVFGRLLPRSNSSYFRSTSPSSDTSERVYEKLPYTLPQHQTSAEPTRHKTVARWARNLQRSFRGEDWVDRPEKGRLGGDLAIIDPKDPLGILSMAQAFKRRGWMTLQVVGGCGLLTAAVWWFARHWQSWTSPQSAYPVVMLPAPIREWAEGIYA